MATAGPRKKLGPTGPKGDMPDHQWSGPRLRFQNPDGTWGDYENLKGPRGEAGVDGRNGISGANGRNGIGVPPGGDADQVLTKIDGTDYNTEWRDPTGGGGAATSAPKLLVVFDTDITTAVGDLVRVTGSNFVSTIADNMNTTIPNGIFGVVTSKPTTTTAGVIFVGVQGGYSGFTTGQPIFVQSDGTPGHPIPAPGATGEIVQQIGFAVSATEFFIYLQAAYERG